MFASVFKKSFNPAKCKTLLRLATTRIKLLRIKREVQLKQMKRELAKLLEAKQEPSAHIRVEHIYREQNILAAYDIIELLCDSLAARLPIIISQKQCPIDIREAVGSIIYAAPRCSDIPELQQLRSLFSTKYGKEFIAIAAELRQDCAVNRVVVEKLSVRGPSIEMRLKLMKDIATEHGLDWDPTAMESQILKPPEDLLDGPSPSFGASQMSMQKSFEAFSSNEPFSPQKQSNGVAEAKTHAVQNTEFLNEKQFIPFIRPMVEEGWASSGSQSNSRMLTMHRLRSHSLSATLSHNYNDSVDKHHSLERRVSLKGVAYAARAAAKSCEHAAAAARAAAHLASERFERSVEGTSSDSESDVGYAVSELHETSKDEHLNLCRASPDDSPPDLRMPLFDEPVYETGFHSIYSSGTKPFSYGNSREEQPVSRSIFHTESYNFNDTESPLHSTRSSERHVDDQARGQQQESSISRHIDDQASGHWQKSSISSSNNWQFQHYNRSRTFQTAGAAPNFNTYEWDDNPGIKTADETLRSGPPERPLPPLPRAQAPMLSKSISFVHPKLPDYDDLTAHFRALKAMSSRK